MTAYVPTPRNTPAFLSDGVTVATLRALSFIHSEGVLWASAGRVNVTRQRLWASESSPDEGFEVTADRLAGLHLLGLLQQREDSVRGMQYRLTDGVVAVVYQLKDCDVCRYDHNVPDLVEAIADARTSDGRWANVCSEHFDHLQCGLGLGRGQILRAEDIKAHIH